MLAARIGPGNSRCMAQFIKFSSTRALIKRFLIKNNMHAVVKFWLVKRVNFKHALRGRQGIFPVSRWTSTPAGGAIEFFKF